MVSPSLGILVLQHQAGLWVQPCCCKDGYQCPPGLSLTDGSGRLLAPLAEEQKGMNWPWRNSHWKVKGGPSYGDREGLSWTVGLHGPGGAPQSCIPLQFQACLVSPGEWDTLNALCGQAEPHACCTCVWFKLLDWGHSSQHHSRSKVCCIPLSWEGAAAIPSSLSFTPCYNNFSLRHTISIIDDLFCCLRFFDWALVQQLWLLKSGSDPWIMFLYSFQLKTSPV